MCPAAARLTDPIAHTSTFGMLAKMAGSLIVGAVVGALATAAIMAVAGLTVLTGGAALVAFLAVGFAVSMVMEATGINEFIDKTVDKVVDSLIPKSIEGAISSGSPNVNINSLKAARAAEPPSVLDVVTCAMHSGGPPPMLAQGSDNVFINSLPAARKDDMTTCGGTIAEGSPDVFVGGGTVTVREIKDERPWWIAALGVAIGVALTLCGKGKMNLSALKSAVPCLLMNMGASVGGSLVGHAIKTSMGNPVNVITGGKVLQEEPDFDLPGPLPLTWARFYSSHDRRSGSLLGTGWSVYSEVRLTIDRDTQGALSAVHYCDAQGRSMTFPPVLPGESHYSTAEGYYLICTEAGQWLVASIDGLYRDFGVPAADFAGPLHMQRLEDRNGNWHAFRYDGAQLRQINDGCGRSIVIVYDTVHAERVAQVQLAKGAENETAQVLVQYRYDAAGNLAEVIDRGGNARRTFVYRDDLLVEHRVPGGLRCNYEWIGSGADARVSRHWTDDGEAYSFQYDLVRGASRVTDQTGRVYQWEWNHDKQPTRYTDPEGHAWLYVWNDNRQLLTMTDPMGAVSKFEYNETGNLSKVINALDQIDATEWHPTLDLPSAETDAAGNCWQYEYDDRGNLIRTIDPEGQETEQFYDSRGLPHTIRDARGGYKHIEWNLRGQMTAYIDCSGKRSEFAYGPQGQLARVTDALGNATAYRVDDAGRVCEIVHPDGSTEKFVYDRAGRMVASIDAAGNQTQYQRNPRGQLTCREKPSGQKVVFAYDPAFRLARLTNENGESYLFGYDRNDRLHTETGLDGVVKRIEHNACGLPIAVTDAAGEADALTLHMQRDALGRLVAKHARGRSTGFRYDQIGQLLQAQQYTDNGGPRTIHDDLQFFYNKRGELIGEAGHLGKLAHHYDEIGNRISTTLPDGRTINSLYYGTGHLHQINVDGGVITDMLRDDAHREILRSQGALDTRFGYDSRGRKTLEHVAQAGRPLPVLHKEWFYDRLGETVRKQHSAHGSTTYVYDPLGRIQLAANAVRSEKFAWDAAANLVDSTQGGGYIKHNRICVYEDKRFDYDIHGRLELKRIGSHTEQRFCYDGEHRLSQVETTRQGVTQLVHFEYDALGRRIRKNDAFGTTCFLWDGLQLLQEQRGSQATTYIYEPDSYNPLARLDTLTAQAPGGAAVYYFHNDLSGIPEEMTDADGAVAWQAQYASWGNVVSERWIGVATAKPLAQNLRFQGQYFDEETGLHYNTFRFYDPDIGRYITPDPIGLLGGNNLHAYAPNPVRYTDPLGWYNGEGTRGLGKYHTFHEHVLDPSEYKMSDAEHFRRANQSVHQRLQTDPAFRREMQTKYPGLVEHVRPRRGGRHLSTSAPGTTWHHADKPGSLVLADMNDHAKFHKIYHPDGTGGRNKWGGGTGCR